MPDIADLKKRYSEYSSEYLLQMRATGDLLIPDAQRAIQDVITERGEQVPPMPSRPIVIEEKALSANQCACGLRWLIIASMTAVSVTYWLAASRDSYGEFVLNVMLILTPYLPLLAVTYKSRPSYFRVILLSVTTIIVVLLSAVGLRELFSVGPAGSEAMALVMILQLAIVLWAGVFAVIAKLLRLMTKGLFKRP